MRWTIYKKDEDGTERTEREVVWMEGEATGGAAVAATDGVTTPVRQWTKPELEYSGTWMGETFVTLNIRCAVPINFQMGDYIIYRGEKFVMNYDPSVVKKARRGTYGEGFTYDNVKFNSLSHELTDVRMLDYVLFDNQIHYTSLPRFDFFCATVDDLCDRLQANTNRWCEENGYVGDGCWVFVTPDLSRSQERCENNDSLRGLVTRTHDTYYGEDTSNPDAKTDQSISVDNMSVWDCLRFIKEAFGYNFIIRGRMVIIGSMSILTPWVFEYGKGNGLYEIERTADDSQAIITKLFAYGSDKNLPTRYYADIDSKAYANVTAITEERSGDIPYADYVVSLPNSTDYLTRPTEIITGVTWYEVVLQSSNATAKGYFDFSDGHQYLHVSASYGNTKAAVDAFKAVTSVGSKIYFLEGVNKNKLDGSNIEYDSGILPNNMSISRLMLPGFPKQSLYAWVKANGGTDCVDATGKATWRGYTAYFSKDQYKPYVMSENADVIGVREGTKYFDGSDGTKEIYPTIEGAEAGGVHLDELVAADMVTDNGVFAEGTEVQNINVTLPDLGSSFDLKALLQSDTVISMKNGYCGGRDFSVKSVTKDGSNWRCNIERDHDDALDLWFPYSHHVSTGGQAIADEPYQLRAGDKYVLTGIEMTSAYVELSAVRLLEETLKFLKANDYVRYTYAPKIDEIFMARQHDIAVESEGMISMHDTLKEGDLMQFQDTDLQFIGSVFIDTLHIKEYGNGQIPTYEVTLRNDKAVGTIERMQQQIDSLSTGVGVGGGIGGGINVTQTRQLIESYGKQLFLSRRDNDEAKGRIDFRAGLTSGTYIKDASGAKIDALGDAEFREIRGREALIVPEVRFELAKGVVGVETQCSCGGQIDEVFPNQNQQGEQLTTGGATLMLEDGEIGRLEVGDLCMGVWHRKEGNNALDTSDDRKGNFAYQGFSTIYFRITNIPATDNEGNDNSDRHYFEYELRPMTTDAQRAMLDRGEITAAQLLAIAGGNGIHPYPLMHFYGRGNSLLYEEDVYVDGTRIHKVGDAVYPERQKFTLRTPEYTARLTDVSNWYFGTLNYTYVNGNLTGFEELLSELGPNPFGNKEKFGTIDCSLWMKGTIVQLPNATDFFMIAQSKLGLLREDESEIVSFKVLDTYRNNKTNAYTYNVYRGETQLSKTITVSQDGLNATFTLNYSDLNGNDSATFTIRGTEKPPIQGSTAKVIEETFLVMKNTAERGQDADFFYILPSAYEVHVKKDGEIVPATQTRTVRVTFNCYKRGTNSDELISSNIYWTGGSTSPTSSPYYADINTENTTSVTIKAYSMVLDEQTHTPAPGVFLAAISIPVIRDGSDGVNAVVADFDDEMHSVACNADGTPMVSGSWTTYAQLWLGNTAQELTNVAFVSNPYGNLISVTRAFNNMKAQLTVDYSVLAQLGANTDSLSIKVELTGSGSDKAVATATIVRVKAGENGTATTYNIVTEPTIIKVDKTGAITNCQKIGNDYYIEAWYNVFVNNVLEGAIDFDQMYGQIRGKATIDDGRTYTVVMNDGMIKVPVIDGTAHGLKLQLWNGDETHPIVYDTETIPVVRDGSDGITGTSTTLQYNSEDRETGWHPNFSQSDKWARTVYTDGDGNETYGTAFRIVGEQGDGGDYVDYKFGISAYDVNGTVGDSKTPPADLPSNSSSWQDAPMATTEAKPYLWMKRTPMDGKTGQQKANTYITYVRVNGKDGENGVDGVSSYTWLRYSDDGETFTGEKVDGGLIGDTALLEETVGSALRSGANLNYFYGANTAGGSNGVNVVENVASGILLTGNRCIRVTTNDSGDYAIRHTLKTIKPSTWYTLEYYVQATNNYIIYLTNKNYPGLIDATEKVIIDGTPVAPNGQMLSYNDDWKNGVWRRHVITFKTHSAVTSNDTGTYLSLQCVGGGRYNFRFCRISLKETKYDFASENLALNGDFSSYSSDNNGTVAGFSKSADSLVLTQFEKHDIDGIGTALRIAFTASGQNINLNLNNDLQTNALITASHPLQLSNVVRTVSKPLTLSFWARHTGTGTKTFRVWQYSNSQVDHVLTSEWQRYEQSFIGTASIQNIVFSSLSSMTVEITGIKLEIGDKATEWSPEAWKQQFGTAEGAWLGTLVWEHPYPSNNFSDYTWTKIKGEDGQQGGRGAMIRSRGEYVATKDGANVTYLAGGENEEYLDVVIASNGLAYQCKKSHGHEIATDDHNYDPINDNTHWQQMNNFENVATKVLFAQLGYVENLGVRYVETTNSGNGMVSISDGVMEVFNAFGSRNIRFGIDENGYAVMQYFDNNGTLLYDLGPNGLSSSDVRNAVLSRLEWKKFTENSFGQVIQNNIVAIFTPSDTNLINAYYFLAKINAGVLVADGIYVQNGSVTDFDKHYFSRETHPLDTQNYLVNGFYYQPTKAKFGNTNTSIKTYNGYGAEDRDYAEFKGYYPNEYKITWPTSSDELMRDPLLYMEVYQINAGGMARKVKVFMRLSVYRNTFGI